jgi:phosphatidate cytidylyltransferase
MTGRARSNARRAAHRRPHEPPSWVRRKAKALRARFIFKREMKLRLVSAGVLIPLVLGATWYHAVSFGIVVLVTGGLVLYEWLQMIGAGDAARLRWVGWIGLAVAAATAFTQPPVVACAALALTVLAAAFVARGIRVAVAPRWVAAGIVYAGVAVVSLIELRKGADGVGAVVFVFLVAWATDTAAFLVGRNIGGPRLWRAVSPSKTWSGAIGGLLAGTLFGALVAVWLKVPLSPAVVAAAALVAVAAQAGDLLESAAKRRFSIKDAGSLIPGHGGVMDRVDGLVTASLATLVLGSLMGGEGGPATGLLALMGR